MDKSTFTSLGFWAVVTGVIEVLFYVHGGGSFATLEYVIAVIENNYI